MKKIGNQGFKYAVDTFSKPELLEMIGNAGVPEQIWKVISVLELKALLEAFGFQVLNGDDSNDALFITHLGITHGIQMYCVDDQVTHARVADLSIGCQVRFPPEEMDQSGCNAWNALWTLGKCYINEDDEPVIQADLLIAGGVTSAAIARFMVEYLDLFDDLQKFIVKYNSSVD